VTRFEPPGGACVAEATETNAIEGLAATCEAIANGRLEDVDRLFEIISETSVPENIRGLAETFASMVVHIEAREFHANQLITELRETQRQLEAAQQRLRQENTDLRHRLRKLEVQYDETQAHREVSEIAESDYFRELQQRAKSMRTKFKPQSATPGQE